MSIVGLYQNAISILILLEQVTGLCFKLPHTSNGPLAPLRNSFLSNFASQQDFNFKLSLFTPPTLSFLAEYLISFFTQKLENME